MDILMPETLFLVVFFVVAGFLLLRIMRFGFRGALFGGRIIETFGPASLGSKAMISSSVRTHVIDENGELKVVLEVVHKSPLSYQLTPVTMSIAGAREIASLLNEAAARAG